MQKANDNRLEDETHFFIFGEWTKRKASGNEEAGKLFM
jgi:hypothetical protein